MSKQTIYTVCKTTNQVLRASRSYLSALEFSAQLPALSCYLCTSEFNFSKGDTMSNVVEFL